MDLWNIPPEAIKPETDAWIPIFKAGSHTPGNTGKAEQFDLARIETIISNTKNHKQPVLIKKGHVHDDNIPAAGVFHSDLKIIDDIVYAKVHYLTPEMHQAIRRGEFPSRSVEISNDNNKEVISAVAMLGSSHPAVKDLGITPADFNAKNKILIFSEADLMDSKEKIKVLETELAENKKALDEAKAEVETIRNEYSAKIKDFKKEIKELSSKEESKSEPEPKNPEVAALEKQVQELRFRERERNIRDRLDNVKIPNVDKENLVRAFSELDENKVLTFSQGEQKSLVDIFFNVLETASAFTEKLEHNNISLESLKEQPVKALSEDALDKQIMELSKKERIPYNEAYEKIMG